MRKSSLTIGSRPQCEISRYVTTYSSSQSFLRSVNQLFTSLTPKLHKMSKEQEKSENVVAMEVEESEEAKQERLQQEATALAIAGTCLSPV